MVGLKIDMYAMHKCIGTNKGVTLSFLGYAPVFNCFSITAWPCNVTFYFKFNQLTNSKNKMYSI